jgi:hypothetical protein
MRRLSVRNTCRACTKRTTLGAFGELVELLVEFDARHGGEGRRAERIPAGHARRQRAACVDVGVLVGKRRLARVHHQRRVRLGRRD